MEIKIVCEYCKGAAKLFGELPCAFCLGLGNRTVLKLLDKQFYASDIVGCISFPEFQALNTNKSQAVELIISASYVGLNLGNVRDKLKECFPAGTTTNTNLEQLIGEPL